MGFAELPIARFWCRHTKTYKVLHKYLWAQNGWATTVGKVIQYPNQPGGKGAQIGPQDVLKIVTFHKQSSPIPHYYKPANEQNKDKL